MSTNSPSPTTMERLLTKEFLDIAEEDADGDFKAVRILMVGKSGSGKSTLAACMGFRDEESKAAPIPSTGVPGTQDIRKTWKHPELPLFMHDSDGIEIQGGEDRQKRAKGKLGVIREFLDQQASLNYFDRIHQIWYLVPVTDTRVMTDGDLMKLLCSNRYKSKFPLQIIVTFTDLDPKGYQYKKNIAPFVDSLSQAQVTSKDIHHVSNVKTGGKEEENEEFDEELVQKQQAALMELSRKTMENLAHEGQKQTWAAAQAVDVTPKLNQTAKVIVNRQFRDSGRVLKDYVVGVLPGNRTPNLEDRILERRRDQICKIWGVPDALKSCVLKKHA